MKIYTFCKLPAVLLIAFLLISFLPITVQAQTWYNTSWAYRKAITIDYTKVGAGPHTNFPLLISRADADLQTKALATGNDILFTSSDGTTKLDHQIEAYTSASGTLVAWVEIPSLSSVANTVIYMYYGNAAAANQQNVTGTWDANFKGVYHLNTVFTDATSNANNATNTGTTSTTGKISGAKAFAASSTNKITMIGMFGNPANVTTSAWVNLVTPDPTHNASEVISLGYNVLIRIYSTNLHAYFWNGTAYGETQFATTGIIGGWHHVAYTFNNTGSVQRLYLDGVQVATSSATAGPISYTQSLNTVIGRDGDGSSEFKFGGSIDEIRVSNSVRSTGWILTEYNNQNAPATFYSVGGEARPYYSRGNGNWTTPATWSNTGHAGAAATTAPGAVSSDYVVIGSSHIITVNANITFQTPIDISSTGTLNMGTYVIGGAGTFTVNAGGTLGIGSTSGISSSGATGNVQVTGTRTFSTGANYTYNGVAAQVTGNGLPATVNNLTISNTASVVSLSANTSITGNVTVSSGTLLLNDATANRASAGGVFTLSGTASLQINGALSAFPANFSTHSVSATSTVEYGNGNLSVAALNSSQNYGNLITSSGGNKTLAGSVGVAGNLTVNSPSTLLINSYTLNRTSVGGTLTVANGASLCVGGNNTMPSNYSTYALGATSTVQYTGSIQSVSLINGANYGNLLINGIGTATLIGNIGVAGDLTCSGGILDIGTYTINRTSAGGALTIYSTLKIGGTNLFPTNYTTHYVIPSSTVEYYGSNQTVAVLNSAQNYGHLTVSGSGTKTLAGNVTVDGNVTFNGATITTGANTLYLSSTGGSSRTSGHVIGNFRKYIATGATTKTFEIGDATNYTPATVAFASVTTAGDLTGSVASTDHINIGLCIIIPLRTANRNWTLTNTGIVFTTYSATFTFVPGDLDLGAAASNFIIAKYSAGWTYPPIGTRTATTIQVTGVTSFSGFQAGETIPLPVTYNSIKATPNNKAISIDWQVGEESGIQKYEIERAVNGINFSKAGEVTAKGNNSSESYQWLDVQPISGNNYYRVRALQADGKAFLSSIVVVKMNADKLAMNVFPNPVKKQQINIGIDEMAKGTYTLLIHNPQGLQMIQRMIDHPGGSFNQTIYLSKIMPAGMFYLQIANEKNKYGQPIFIE